MTLSMRRLAVLIASVGFLWGCGGDETAPKEDAGSGMECQVDSDCDPGERCNLRTNECEPTGPGGGGDPEDAGTGGEDGGEDEDGGLPPLQDVDDDDPEEDTGGEEEDVLFPTPDSGSEEDTSGGEDTSPDEDTSTDEDVGSVDDAGMDGGATDAVEDAGDVDDGETGTDAAGDAGSTDGGDVGSAPSFSGCTSSLDCDPYQTCDTSVGRCVDDRPTCDTTEDCSGSQLCLGGRCVSRCGFFGCSGGLSCKSVSTGPNSSADFCLASCTPFTSNPGCAPDAKCAPFFGSGDGLCRGRGKKAVGESCETDWGVDGCRAGSVCLNRRGEKRCESFCSTSSSPSCGSDSYCTGDFDMALDGSEASDPAGVCLSNCGGLGNADSSLCDSGESCQPESADEGYCTEEGSVAQDGRCDPANDSYCETPSQCYQTDETEGVCRSSCDPTKSESANRCSSGQACLQTSQGYGICLTTCTETGSDSASNCPSFRPSCYDLADSRTVTPSSTSGVCGPT